MIDGCDVILIQEANQLHIKSKEKTLSLQKKVIEHLTSSQLKFDTVIWESADESVKEYQFSDFIALKESQPQPTWNEKENLFAYRTAYHIQLVNSCAMDIVNAYPEFKELLSRAEKHDESKYLEPEATAYVELTWKKKCENEKIPYICHDPNMKSKIDIATLHHIKHNRHHPEFHARVEDMTDLDIAEMIADWAAMGLELGNNPRTWYEKVSKEKYSFSDKQKQLIDRLLKIFEKTSESLHEAWHDHPDPSGLLRAAHQPENTLLVWWYNLQTAEFRKTRDKNARHGDEENTDIIAQHDLRDWLRGRVFKYQDKIYMIVYLFQKTKLVPERLLWDVYHKVNQSLSDDENIIRIIDDEGNDLSSQFESTQIRLERSESGKFYIRESQAELEDIMKIQLSDPCNVSDQYMRGLSNGLILAKHVGFDQEGEPEFINADGTRDKVCDKCKHHNCVCEFLDESQQNTIVRAAHNKDNVLLVWWYNVVTAEFRKTRRCDALHCDEEFSDIFNNVPEQRSWLKGCAFKYQDKIYLMVYLFNRQNILSSTLNNIYFNVNACLSENDKIQAVFDDDGNNISSRFELTELCNTPVQFDMLSEDLRSKIAAGALAASILVNPLAAKDVSARATQSSQQENDNVVAKVIAGEAASEGYEGMYAVACVIQNRMSKNSQTPIEIVSKARQFSAYDDKALMNRNYEQVKQQADEIASKIGSLKDITDGATHYVAKWLYDKKQSDSKSWISGMKKVKEIGKHVFMKES